jgi:hypothetical protein
VEAVSLGDPARGAALRVGSRFTARGARALRLAPCASRLAPARAVSFGENADTRACARGSGSLAREIAYRRRENDLQTQHSTRPALEGPPVEAVSLGDPARGAALRVDEVAYAAVRPRLSRATPASGPPASRSASFTGTGFMGTGLMGTGFTGTGFTGTGFTGPGFTGPGFTGAGFAGVVGISRGRGPRDRPRRVRSSARSRGAP